jgi:dienelactone hydrolase
VAEFLAATHPKAQGVILMHGALPLEMLQIASWPKHVPVQLHYNDKDPFRSAEGEATFEKAAKDSGAAFEDIESAKDRQVEIQAAHQVLNEDQSAQGNGTETHL